jgi:sensor histidine kinase YesM
MKAPWYKSKWFNLIVHITFWGLLFSLPYLLKPSFQEGRPMNSRRPPQEIGYAFNLLKGFFWMGVFYLNAHVLSPRLLFKKQYFYYTLALVGVLALLSGLETGYFSLIGREARFFSVQGFLRGFLMFNFLPFLSVVATSITYRMFTDKMAAEAKAKEVEAEHLKSELSFLRSQISPHFIFNVLNNIVALARKKSDLVEPSLIKLSGLMRYFLYEHEGEMVALEKEVDYLQSYIDLQQQRFTKADLVRFDVKGIDKAYQIEPMLLIPFVENAFKHGDLKNGTIEIQLEVKHNTLSFSVANTISPMYNTVKDETSGIGLANVKRRLNLLYGTSHNLTIESKKDRFVVLLGLKLH